MRRPALEVHAGLALSAGAALALQWRFAVDRRSAWLLLAAPVAAVALTAAWRRQRSLSLPAVLLVALAYHLTSILLFRHLGFNGDLDPNATYNPQGHELLDGSYPNSEYPVAAVFLFALEAALEPHPPQIANAFLMLPFLLLAVWAIWALRTRWSAWLATVVAVWPLGEYYWEFRYDAAVAALLVAGLLLARRGHWGWSGCVLAIGACFKWSPGLSFLVLAAWLVGSRRFRDAARHVVAFIATAAAFYVPCLAIWPAHDVLASFRAQSTRSVTNESVWYWLARPLGLTHGTRPEWAAAGAPHWVDVAVTIVQVLLLAALVAAAMRRPGRRDAAIALAALAPVVFLVANRVFSVQFVLVLAAGWAVAASLAAPSRRAQAVAGSAAAAAVFANAFVYPFDDPAGVVSWRPYALLTWIVTVPLTVVIAWWALRAPATRPEEVAEPDSPPLAARTAATVVVAVAVAVAAIVLAVNLLLASTLPYSGWDSMYYGQWSRLIGLHGGFRHPGIVATHLHRPLFYVLQGELWRVAGFHQALGRLLSLAFAILLVACVARLAYVRFGRVGAAVASLLAVAVTPLERHASDGLTDVPAAAMLALVAVVAFTMRAGRRRTVLLALTALLAVLAKPSGIVGCAALCLALLLGPLVELPRRLRVDLAPICAGLVVGLAYDWTQAHREGMGLQSFLQSGVGSGIWAAKASAARPGALWGWFWLGRPLHVLLVFAILFVALRLAGLAHRPAALLATPAAWVWAWLGPAVAGTPFHAGFGATGLATIGSALVLPLTALAPAELQPARLELARLAVWAVPSLAIWLEYAAYDARLASAAWPPLLLLLTAVAAAIVGGAARRAPSLSLVPVTVFAVAALAGLTLAAGLGTTGWQQYRSAGLSGVTRPAQMRNVAYGPFDAEVAALRQQVGPGERIYGEDGRLPFLFPGRAVYDQPKSCSDLVGYRAVVLLFDDETIAQARLEGAPATLADWEACSSPHLTLVAEQPSSYAVFVTGAPRGPVPPAACSVAAITPGLYAVFGAARSAEAAERLRKQQAHYGFVQLKVVRTGCESYLVLEPVADREMGAGIVREAKTVDIRVELRELGSG